MWCGIRTGAAAMGMAFPGVVGAWPGRGVAHVFVSFASADLGWARRLHDWLDADGHEVFLDRDLQDGIVFGEVWAQRLYERLRWRWRLVRLATTGRHLAALSSVDAQDQSASLLRHTMHPPGPPLSIP
jgi:hypothetical protein